MEPIERLPDRTVGPPEMCPHGHVAPMLGLAGTGYVECGQCGLLLKRKPESSTIVVERRDALASGDTD